MASGILSVGPRAPWWGWSKEGPPGGIPCVVPGWGEGTNMKVGLALPQLLRTPLFCMCLSFLSGPLGPGKSSLLCCLKYLGTLAWPYPRGLPSQHFPPSSLPPHLQKITFVKAA